MNWNIFDKQAEQASKAKNQPQKKVEATASTANATPQGYCGYDQEDYRRRVETITKARYLMDAAQNGSRLLKNLASKLDIVVKDYTENRHLVEQSLNDPNFDFSELKEYNVEANDTLFKVVREFFASPLNDKYSKEVDKEKRKNWTLSETDKATIKGGEKALEFIENKSEDFFLKMAMIMKGYPIAYFAIIHTLLIMLPFLFFYIGRYWGRMETNLHLILGGMFIAYLLMIIAVVITRRKNDKNQEDDENDPKEDEE